MNHLEKTKHLLAFIIFLVAGLYITFPLILHLGSLTTGFGDELVIAWIQNWVIHALATAPLTLFEANIYYPYDTTLAYSDLFLASSILSSIPVKFIGQPIVAVNFTLISSLVFLGFFTYLLSFYITKDFLPSLLAGLLVVFSPAVLDKKVHLQILSIYWIPLSILFFLHYIKTFRERFLILSLIFFVVQTYNSFLPCYFLVFFYGIFLVYFFIYKRPAFKRILNWTNAIIIFVALTAIIPVVIPYYKVSNEFGVVRDIRDTIHFALQPEDLLFSSEHSRFANALNSISISLRDLPSAYTKPGYIGFVFTILSIISIIFFIKRFKKRNLIYNTFTTTALAGLVLSLGPALHFHGLTIHKPFPVILPYALFYYVLPGFKGFRNSARWEILFIISIAIAIAIMMNLVLKKLVLPKKIILYSLIIAFTVGEFNYPMRFFPITQTQNFPQEQRWLTSVPANSSVIIMPAYNWNMSPFVQEEIKRVYYSAFHFRRTLNGYSGFSPPPWQEAIYSFMGTFPKKESIQKMEKMGLDYLIVDKAEYKKLYNSGFVINTHKIENPDQIIRLLLENDGLLLEKKFGDVYIFSFRK